MKKIYTLYIVLFLITSHEVNAQTTSASLKSPQPESTIINPKPVNEQEILNQIAQIDSHLASIEIKRNHVSSNPTEKALATEQGWFEDMKKIEKSLLKKKNELKKLIDN